MNLIKRIAIGATTGAILLGSVVAPTFASSEHHKHKSKPSNIYIVEVENKNTYTVTKTTAVANTGGNIQGSKKSDDNKIKTGDAFAVGKSEVAVNTTIIKF